MTLKFEISKYSFEFIGNALEIKLMKEIAPGSKACMGK